MTVLTDTNVLLDVLLPRPAFLGPSAQAWALAETLQFEPLVCAVSLTTIHYVVDRYSGQAAADRAVRVVHRLASTTAVDAQVVSDAITSGNPDFEDAIQAASAVRAGATHVLTRDPGGFSRTPLQVLSPLQLVAMVRGPATPP